MLIATGIICMVSGIFFKVMHWPFGSVISFLGVFQEAAGLMMLTVQMRKQRK